MKPVMLGIPAPKARYFDITQGSANPSVDQLTTANQYFLFHRCLPLL